MSASELFKKLGEKHKDIKPGKMFGCACYKTPNGKAAAMLWHDYLVIKPGEQGLTDVLKIKGAKIFEPMEGRPMNGWVQLPFDQEKEWNKYLKKSIDIVKLIPAKESKKKTK